MWRTAAGRLVKATFLAIAGLFALLAVTTSAQAQSAASAFTTGYRYDAGSRLVGTIRPDPDGAGPLKFAAVRNTYSAQGVLTLVETGELSTWFSESVLPGNWTGFTIHQRISTAYDIWGRKLAETVSDGGGVAHALTQYSYDTVGRVECVAQRMNPAAYGSLPASACALGTEGAHGPDRITKNTYDAVGRVLTIKKAFATGDEINYATYTYYPNGPLESVLDARNNKSYYAYDGLKRLEYWYFPSKTTAYQHSTTDFEQYGYDKNGNRTSLRKRDGNLIAYEYDSLNRLTKEDLPGGTSADVYYSYDLRSLQLAARFSSLSGAGITASFDGFGRQAAATTDQSGSTLTLQYQYDAEGNRTRLTHPDGQAFRYEYDGLNRVNKIIEDGTNTTLVQTTYDSAGRRAGLSRGSGVTSTTFGYDSVSRLNSLTQDLASTGYDEARTFTHNPASQIITRTLSNTVYSFTQAPTAATNYAVNGLNQYTTLTSGTSVTVAHDANGNLTSDGATIFSYDVLNRMTGASGAKTGTLAYDPKGRLYQTSGGASGTTRFLYDGDALVAEYNASGAVTNRYVHGSGVDEPQVWYSGSTVGSGNRRYLHADHLGSILAATNGSGTALAVNTYDPYGVPSTGNSGRFQYTGQIMLPDLGLYHYKARVYNAALGRFMQTDPIGYKDDLDLYTYVGNDPTNKTDPDGQIVFLPLIPVALKVIDVAMTAYEVYSAAQTGGAAAVAKVGLETAALAALPGGKILAKVADKVHDASTATKVTDRVGDASTAAKGGTYTLKDADGTVVKTGRTNDLKRREGEHGRNHPDKTFDVDKRTDNRAAQRGREQDLHDANPSAHAKNGGMDKINGISPDNPKRDEYLRAGRELP